MIDGKKTVDVTIYHECCPVCGGVKNLDAYDGPDVTPTAQIKCVDRGHKFDIEQLWILSE